MGQTYHEIFPVFSISNCWTKHRFSQYHSTLGTHFRHQERGFSSSCSSAPIEAMNAKGQANNIIKAAKKSRMGNRVKVMKAICKTQNKWVILTQFQTEKVIARHCRFKLKIPHVKHKRVCFNPKQTIVACVTILNLQIWITAETVTLLKANTVNFLHFLRSRVCLRIHPHLLFPFCSLTLSKYLAWVCCKSYCPVEEWVCHSTHSHWCALTSSAVSGWGKAPEGWLGERVWTKNCLMLAGVAPALL